MRREGENVPPPQQQPRGNGRPQGGRPEGRNRNAGGGGRPGGGRNSGQRGQHRGGGGGRGPRQPYDPRREPQYSQPSDHQQARPDPNRPAPIIQRKQRK